MAIALSFFANGYGLSILYGVINLRICFLAMLVNMCANTNNTNYLGAFMKKIALFFKGIKQAFVDSWFAILVLALTCFVGVIGVGFCYRTVAFYIRQPDSVDYFENQSVVSYYFKGDKINLKNEITLDGYVGRKASTQFVFAGKTFDLTLLDNDSYNEKKLDFASIEMQIVINEDVDVNVGDNLTITGKQFRVVGKTTRDSYTNAKFFDQVKGDAKFYFEKQLSRADMTKLEKAVDEKLNRDTNWTGEMSAQAYLFVALGVIVMIIISVNVLRLFNLYVRKNSKRYSLYRMMGMSSSRLACTKLGEMIILLILSLPLALIIDGFALRPLSTLVGITFMYDFFDLFMVSICVILPFVLVLAANLILQAIVTARKKRGK